jgi:hypothetical protein
MDVQQRVTRLKPKHFRHVQGIGPSVAEEIFQSCMKFVQHLLLKGRNFAWQLGASEIEEKRAFHDRHFDRMQIHVGVDQPWNVVAGNAQNVESPQDLVYF